MNLLFTYRADSHLLVINVSTQSPEYFIKAVDLEEYGFNFPLPYSYSVFHLCSKPASSESSVYPPNILDLGSSMLLITYAEELGFFSL
jgi:hypothetical protein